MDARTPLISGDEQPAPQMARRVSRSTFANTNAKPKKVQKPSKAIGLSAIGDLLLDTLLFLLLIIAVLTAVAITGYAFVRVLAPPLPFQIPKLPSDVEGNILVGVLFFWMEALVIVLGLRFLDRARVRMLARRQLFSIQDALAGCINGMDDARYAYAVHLDENADENGHYKELGGLNRDLAQMRRDFVREIYCDVELTEVAARLVGRVMRTLDIFVQETYELVRSAEALNRATPPVGLEACLIETFDRTETSELRSLERLIDEIRRDL
jgi:hypothetical protein